MIGNGHKGSVLDLCWVGKKALSSGSDGRVLIWTPINYDLHLESQGMLIEILKREFSML